MFESSILAFHLIFGDRSREARSRLGDREREFDFRQELFRWRDLILRLQLKITGVVAFV